MPGEIAARWPELLPGMTLRRVDGASHHNQKDSSGIVASEINALGLAAQAKQ